LKIDARAFANCNAGHRAHSSSPEKWFTDTPVEKKTGARAVDGDMFDIGINQTGRSTVWFAPI
jgi:hypothetical protein